MDMNWAEMPTMEVSAMVIVNQTKNAAEYTERLLAALREQVGWSFDFFPLALMKTETVRDALNKGDDGVINWLLNGSERQILLALDDESEKLLDDLQAELKRQGLERKSLTIFRKLDAAQKHCEERGLTSLPATVNIMHVYATEAAKLIGQHLTLY